MSALQFRRRTAGYTLAEMLVATASAGVLMVGLTSALYVASQTLDFDDGSVVARSRDSRAVAQLMGDVSEALSFSEKTPTAITFLVPDRTGDDEPDEIRYFWTGAANTPLVYSFNGAMAPLIDDLQGMQFDFITRTLVAPTIVNSSPPAGVVFEEFTDTQQGNNRETIAIATPPGAVEGDLLVAALAADDDVVDLSAPAGWTLFDSGYGEDSKVTLSLWWKLAGASEPTGHTFNWVGDQRAYGWMMRFTGHDPTTPIHAISTGIGDSDSPACPSVTTSVDQCMILRIGGFDDDDVTNGDAGMAGHTTICAGESNNGGGSCSGAAAYRHLDEAGDSGGASFSISNDEEYRTVTIAIAPDTN